MFITYTDTTTGATYQIRVAHVHSDINCQGTAPTPADATVGGRVQTALGVPIYRATVTLTSSTGAARTVRTNQLGSFQFTEVDSGQSYVLQASHPSYTFQPRVIVVHEDVLDIILSPNLK
jgi:hypothetical protein